jgi:DNA-binding NarL/FixJ family response regulator
MNVVIADSNELVRIGLKAILKEMPEATLIGEASNSEALMHLLEGIRAAVILIDFTASGFSIDDIPAGLRMNPDFRFVALTYLQSPQTLQDALKGGVMGYIKKDCDLHEIMDAIRETSKGQKFFCGKILETIHEANLDPEDLDRSQFSCDPVLISERENEIIVLISEGYTNEQIADMLFLSRHTVNTHRKNILAKLGVKNTAGIVMYAVKTHLVSPNKFLFAST